MTILFGILGYIFIKLKCEPAPLILAFVLGPLMDGLKHIAAGCNAVAVQRGILAASIAASAAIDARKRLLIRRRCNLPVAFYEPLSDASQNTRHFAACFF